MKPLLLCFFVSTLPAFLIAETPESEPVHADREGLDATTRFIFYSVLEGLYDDGVSTEDVNQILLKREGEGYFHFIYSCPICSPTVYALQAYQDRPEQFYRRKDEASTFGFGLSKEIRDRLYSEDPKVRLSVINELIHIWISRRMELMKLAGEARKALEHDLGEKRKQGERTLQMFQKQNAEYPETISSYAPAFAQIDECAACNGAVGKPMKP